MDGNNSQLQVYNLNMDTVQLVPVNVSQYENNPNQDIPDEDYPLFSKFETTAAKKKVVNLIKEQFGIDNEFQVLIRFKETVDFV